MAGKIAKLAAGVMMTHFHRSKVDTELLAAVARETGIPESMRPRPRPRQRPRVTSQRRALRPASPAATSTLQLARDRCIEHSGGRLDCEVVMVDFEGSQVLARA